jgi:hypothetical protein
MYKNLQILGNGQIWNLKKVSPAAWHKTFEDLFSGRALGEMARDTGQLFPRNKRIFSRFKEKGRITGLSVTKALLSRDRQANEAAISLLEILAKNASLGIKALSQGRGFKPNWPTRERNYWKNLDIVIIGGGVSRGLTGEILVRLIKRYLSKNSFSCIKVFQAEFPGKESGFLGAVLNLLKPISKEAKKRGLKKIAAIGLDLGRDKIGAGLLAINPIMAKIILRRKNEPWLFRSSLRTPCQRYLKIFKDSRRDYTKTERAKGKYIRGLILRQMANLIIKAQVETRKSGLETSRNIGVAVPGSATSDGYIINSTDYLPFFKKQDGFNFARKLEDSLAETGMPGYRVNIINDGIAAGIANVYFGSFRTKQAKFAFFGVGSGLGGCVGRVYR